MFRASGQAMLPVAANGSGALRSQCASFFLLEPAGLEPVVAMRQFWIGRAHRTDQRIDHLALDAIVEMAGIGDVLETAPAIGDLLVLGERIGDQRKGPLVGFEGFRQRLGCRLALLPRAILQQVQRRLDREFFAPTLKRRPEMVWSNSRFQAA